MRPIFMKLCGWGPYRDEQCVDFEKLSVRGLFLITGDTGAGKTTVFDGIAFALFGDMSGQVREKNSVRSDFADAETPTYAELVMRHREKQYRIYRSPEYMRPKKRKGQEDSFVREKEKAILTMPDGETIEGSSAVTRKIQEILGMDIRQFRQISMIAQGEFARLLTAPPREKTQIFREIFDTVFYERFARILHRRAQELYEKLQMYDHKLQEAVSGFGCEEEAWKQLIEQESLPLEQICDYLRKKETEAAKEKKRLAAALSGTEKKLEQINAGLQEIDGLVRKQEEAQELERAKEEGERFYRKKEAIENWFSCVEELIAGETEAQAAERQAKEAQERLKKAREAYRKAETEAAKRRQDWDRAQSLYRSAVVGIAAALVKEGQPCPVCGSLEHPHIAKAGDDIPDEKKLKSLEKAREEGERALTEAYGQALARKGEAQQRQEYAGEQEEKLAEIKAGYAQAEKACGREILSGLTTGKTGDKPGKEQDKAPNRTKLQCMLSRFGEIIEAYRRAGTLLAEKRREIDRSMAKLEISSPEETKERLACLQERRREITEEKKAILEAQKGNYLLLESAKKVRSSLEEKRVQREQVKESYGIVKDLDNLTCGNNVRRLVFEQYVLAGCFEEILREANRRLVRMTSDRFTLHRVEEVGDGRSRDNLEIRVMDHYTGKYRSVKTLSGGETFKASLALALGLSDMIQKRSGGIAVDCLFIDEGFGALDRESLEQACDTLKRLAGKNCMIGIISHVPELKEQIENKLIVKRTNHGSFLA